MYFLVNASPTKALGVATSTLQVYRSYDVEGTGQDQWSKIYFLVNACSS